jgi:hypothetical protein
MRDTETIDGGRGLLSRAQRATGVVCDQMLSTEPIDQLLEERAAAAARPKRTRKSAQLASDPKIGG